jgi:hypothetical protein
MVGACSTHKRNENKYKVMVENPNGMRSLGRRGRGWED